VNRIDRETEKEARAHKGCRAIQEEENLFAEMYVYSIYVKYFYIVLREFSDNGQ
jgi:hypothetical protein